MLPLDFGKNKGKTLADTASTAGNTDWQAWYESLKKAEIDLKIVKHLSSTPAKVDIGLKDNLNTSREFSILR